MINIKYIVLLSMLASAVFGQGIIPSTRPAGVDSTVAVSNHVDNTTNFHGLVSTNIPTKESVTVAQDRANQGITNSQTGVTLNLLSPSSGFESQYGQTVAFDPTSRTATITPVGTQFRVTAGGITYAYTNTITSTVASVTSGGKFCYITNDGSFIAVDVPWTINGEAQVIYAQYDAITTSTVFTVDERHGIAWTDDIHRQQHSTVGSRWANGSGLNLFHNANDVQLTAANASGSNTCVSISSGVVFDEDVVHTTVTNGVQSSTLITTNNAGVFPILYKTNSVWRKRAGTTFPFAFNVDVPQYINTNGVAVNVTEDQFFVYFLVVIGSVDNTNCFLVSDTQTYSSTLGAQTTSSVSRISTIMGGLPYSETLVAYRLIFNYNSGGGGQNPTSVKNVKLRDVTDFRMLSSGVIIAGSPAAVPDDDSMYVTTNQIVQTVLGGEPDKVVSAYAVSNVTATFSLTMTNSPDAVIGGAGIIEYVAEELSDRVSTNDTEWVVCPWMENGTASGKNGSADIGGTFHSWKFDTALNYVIFVVPQKSRAVRMVGYAGTNSLQEYNGFSLSFMVSYIATNNYFASDGLSLSIYQTNQNALGTGWIYATNVFDAGCLAATKRQVLFMYNGTNGMPSHITNSPSFWLERIEAEVYK